MPLLKCKNICLGYDGKEIIHNLNFEINAGDYLCIIGENGSGKSTLMKTILGLQKQISGEVITSDGLLKNQIGYLPQQTAVQKDFPATVWEIVISGFQGKCGIRPFYTKAQKQCAKNNIAKMGIYHLTNRCYRELSGGQQQRVLLARALCATTKLLLLDEPTAGLDPKATAELYNVIKNLNEEGITIVMISHDIAATVENASHVLHLGDNVFFGTKIDYINSVQDTAASIGGDEQ